MMPRRARFEMRLRISEAEVDRLTAELSAAGYEVVSGPRTTGDGYYESCVLGPEGNQVEITV